MRVWSRIIGTVVPVVAFLVVAQGSAWAVDPVEDDPVVDLADIQNGGVTTRPCGDYPPGYEPGPGLADIVYRTVQGKQLKLDVYKVPTSFGSPTNFAALVVVHGGGWFTGCKRWSATFAKDAATGVSPSPFFLTFNVDYRLSCGSSPDPLIDHYCGWNFAKPGDDVEAAVAWVEDHAEDYLQTGQTWNGKIALFGSSAGGNLAFGGAMHAASGSTKKPDAVAGWSGLPDLVDPQNASYCWDSAAENWCNHSVEQYTGCTLASCGLTWNKASPDWWIDSADPPTFIANARDELAPPAAAEAFAGNLQSAGVARDICWVDDELSPYAHGLSLRDWPCDDGDGTVWERTMDWLDEHT